jgi:hypothetical protein
MSHHAAPGDPKWQGRRPGSQGDQANWPAPPPNDSPDWPVQQEGSQYQRQPDNYLVWAILCTALCCLPLGTISIFYSTKVSGLWAAGRHAEAQGAARKAKTWAIGGAVVGPIIYLCLIPLIIGVIVAITSITNPPSTRNPSDPPGTSCDPYTGRCFPD